MTPDLSTCPSCRMEFRLRSDGRLPGHVDRSIPVGVPRRDRACPGSREFPTQKAVA